MELRDFTKRLKAKQIMIAKSDQPMSAIVTEERYDQFTGEKLQPLISNVQLAHLQKERDDFVKGRDGQIARITELADKTLAEFDAAIEACSKVAGGRK